MTARHFFRINSSKTCFWAIPKQLLDISWTVPEHFSWMELVQEMLKCTEPKSNSFHISWESEKQSLSIGLWYLFFDIGSFNNVHSPNLAYKLGSGEWLDKRFEIHPKQPLILHSQIIIISLLHELIDRLWGSKEPRSAGLAKNVPKAKILPVEFRHYQILSNFGQNCSNLV